MPQYNFERLVSLPVQPLFRQSDPNDSIELDNIKVEVSDAERRPDHSDTASARIRFGPNAGLEFDVSMQPGVPAEVVLEYVLSAADRLQIKFPNFGTRIDVSDACYADRTIYFPLRDPIQTRVESASITRATLHFFNWPTFRGPENFVLLKGDPPLQSGVNCGRVTLKFDGWVMIVSALEDTRVLNNKLRASGGYVITHVASLRRDDNSGFSTAELDEVLNLLTHFFAFALGTWAGPSLTTGFDSDDSKVFEHWGIGRSTQNSWEGSRSWFDQNHADFLSALAPGFAARWKEPIWKRALQESVYWYVGANQAGKAGLGVDSSLLLIQAALELLAWTYCVLDRKTLSDRTFQPRSGMIAADKLRVLASLLGIPLEIPPQLTALHSKAGSKWSDSMDALTDLRNHLVHPSAKKNVPDGAYFDGWRLGTRLIELVVLAICGYRGECANRLVRRNVGEVEVVPWGKQ